MSNTTPARLDRIEAALVATIVLLAGMQATKSIPLSWQHIANEEKNGLYQAMLDLIALQKELQQGTERHGDEDMATIEANHQTDL